MARHPSILSVSVLWRGKKYVVEVNSEASLLELGEELQKMTDVKANTIRLFVPQSSTKSSRLLIPFSDEHSSIRLQDAEISDGKPLRMMGVLENEVDQLLKESQANLRIAGFEEEERRLKQRSSRGPRQSLKLPEGPYIFADFRTLEIPGVEFNPPPSEALKRMHMLAADPGIVAIMNKHRWRVGIMTEMAPEGYVGVSPVCLLGLNKNHGEEISLRLRTDDLKGFRKYDRIKQTLLHELAHMVYSEHDENFYALDKQLNQEASALDWTQSKSHTLANNRFHVHDDLDFDFELESSLPQKLGGESSTKPANARVAAAAAAYHRLADSSKQESDDYKAHADENNQDEMESDSVDIQGGVTMITTPNIESVTISNQSNFDDTLMRTVGGATKQEVIDPVDLEVSKHKMAIDTTSLDHTKRVVKTMDEPDPDDTEVINNALEDDAGDHSQSQLTKVDAGYDHPEEYTVRQTPDVSAMSGVTYEPDPDDEELRRLQDPVTMFCERLAKAVKMLQNEVNPSEIVVVQETLFKIIRNASENPNDMKYKRLRKANAVFQRRIANCKAAMDILFMVGFVEEVTSDEVGTVETYLVLKRDDPGLLWLAKSSLETAFARS